jgi:uncharacterized protein YutE (UPF0331/DUF86 family)
VYFECIGEVERQANLVGELVKELEVEESYRGVERLVQLIVQALLDLGLMIIVAFCWRRPRTYSEIGYILREHSVIGDDEARLPEVYGWVKKRSCSCLRYY